MRQEFLFYFLFDCVWLIVCNFLSTSIIFPPCLFLSDNVVVRVDGICCLLRSTEPNRTAKRNQVNSTRNRRIELKAKYSWAVRKD